MQVLVFYSCVVPPIWSSWSCVMIHMYTLSTRGQQEEETVRLLLYVCLEVTYESALKDPYVMLFSLICVNLTNKPASILIEIRYKTMPKIKRLKGKGHLTNHNKIFVLISEASLSLLLISELPIWVNLLETKHNTLIQNTLHT